MHGGSIDIDRAAIQAMNCRNVGRQLGLTVSHDGMVLCPVHTERTPSCKLYDGRAKSGWYCFGCQTSGDAVDLVRAVKDCSFPEALAFLELDIDTTGSQGRQRRRKPQKASEAPKRTEQPKPKRNPQEYAALWARSRPVDDEEEVVAWLESRRIDVGRMIDYDLGRTLPPGVLPGWAGHGKGPAYRTWRESGRRLLVPMWDVTGHLGCLKARKVTSGKDDVGKDLNPPGSSLKGMVFADSLSRCMLAGDLMDGDISRWPGWLVIVEGIPDFLSEASHWSDADEDAPAVLGLTNGSWTSDLANRVPDGTRVIVATDPDDAGDRYARNILENFANRIRDGKLPKPKRYRNPDA